MVAGTISMKADQKAIEPKATGKIFNLPLLSGKLPGRPSAKILVDPIH